VKFFDVSRGFGYIELESGSDVYVDREALPGEGFRYLAAGERVDVVLRWDERRDVHVAASVSAYGHRERGAVVQFDAIKGYGLVKPDHSDALVFAHHSDILGQESRKSLDPGEQVWFEVEPRDRGLQAVRIKRADPRPPLHRFASIVNERRWWRELADLAEREPWDYRQVSPPRRTMLRNYVGHTFARIEQQHRIGMGHLDDAAVACFHTGLVTTRKEPIYAFFEENAHSHRTDTPWRLAGFLRASDHRLLRSFQQLPGPATYYDEPAELVFDTRLPLYIDAEHLVEDHVERFPPSVRDNPAVALARLEIACSLARQEVYRNYRTAVPQFYRGEIQMLLPLYLEKPDTADLALVVAKIGNQYRGYTVLTLEMAYTNARLIGRPYSEWLTPAGA